MKRFRLILFVLLGYSAAAHAGPVADLREVGRASLKVLFWSVFDSTLYSPDGEFSHIEPGVALEIEYRRDFSADGLVRSTRREWEKLALCTESCESWLSKA